MEQVLIITNNQNKKSILKKLATEKKLVNLKFLTFPELKKKLYFGYDITALEYIIKTYHVNLAVAQKYLANMYFLNDIKDSKIQNLLKIKQELEAHNLLIKNPLFKEYIINKKVILYDHPYLSFEEKKILSNFSNFEEITPPKKVNIPLVYEALDISEEVDFVLRKISALIAQKVPLNKIILIADNSYHNLLKRYFEIYNLPLNIANNNSYYGTIIAQEFLNNYDKLAIDVNIAFLEEHFSNLTDLITIINKSALIEDKALRKEFIINDLKNTYLKEDVYQEAIRIGTIKETYNADEYVFLLGFNINSYPQTLKDEDYLSDSLKKQLGLDTSLDLNQKAKAELISFLNHTFNLTITYKKRDTKSVYYPSILIDELNLKVEKINLSEQISYSLLNSSLLYAQDLDDWQKYNTINPNLSLFRNNLNIKYKEYNNVFQNLDLKLLTKKLQKGLTLSYTNLEMYNECAFKYYVSKILNLDIFEENFKTLIGQIVHHILEIGITRNIDITLEIAQFLKEKNLELTPKEYFYLENLSTELEEILKIIQNQATKCSLKQYLTEEELKVVKEYDEVNVIFKGLIDKVIYDEIANQKYLMVIDYKTGQNKVTLDNLEYGLNLQLPIYLYLLKKSARFQDAVIGGFFIQRLLANKFKFDSHKDIAKQREEYLKLDGYINSSQNVMQLIDSSYKTDSYIKGLKFKKDGELAKTIASKALSVSQMDDLTNQVEKEIDQVINNILKGNFPINPKVINSKNISCPYCKFKDICYKTANDDQVIGGENNELDSTTATSD